MIRLVRRAVFTGILAAVLVPTALASNGEPQKKLTKAGQAQARAASLRRSDFGPGWKATRSPSDNSNPRCSTYNPDNSDLVETGDYDSPDFGLADGSTVSVSTGVFLTEKMAKTAYGRVAAPGLPGCFAEIFRKGTGTPNAVKIAFAGPIGFPKRGDRLNAYRVRGTVAAQQTVSFTIDLVFFNKGRIDVAMLFLGIGKALPGAMERSLAARVAARAA
jgi:type II secretory pathway pseudopilin PulG